MYSIFIETAFIIIVDFIVFIFGAREYILCIFSMIVI